MDVFLRTTDVHRGDHRIRTSQGYSGLRAKAIYRRNRLHSIDQLHWICQLGDQRKDDLFRRLSAEQVRFDRNRVSEGYECFWQVSNKSINKKKTIVLKFEELYNSTLVPTVQPPTQRKKASELWGALYNLNQGGIIASLQWLVFFSYWFDDNLLSKDKEDKQE